MLLWNDVPYDHYYGCTQNTLLSEHRNTCLSIAMNCAAIDAYHATCTMLYISMLPATCTVLFLFLSTEKPFIILSVCAICSPWCTIVDTNEQKSIYHWHRFPFHFSTDFFFFFNFIMNHILHHMGVQSAYVKQFCDFFFRNIFHWNDWWPASWSNGCNQTMHTNCIRISICIFFHLIEFLNLFADRNSQNHNDIQRPWTMISVSWCLIVWCFHSIHSLAKHPTRMCKMDILRDIISFWLEIICVIIDNGNPNKSYVILWMDHRCTFHINYVVYRHSSYRQNYKLKIDTDKWVIFCFVEHNSHQHGVSRVQMVWSR